MCHIIRSINRKKGISKGRGMRATTYLLPHNASFLMLFAIISSIVKIIVSFNSILIKVRSKLRGFQHVLTVNMSTQHKEIHI